MKYLIIILSHFLLINSSRAIECMDSNSPYALGKAIFGEKKLPSFWTQEIPNEEVICLDLTKMEFSEKQKTTLQELKKDNSIDDQGCINFNHLDKNQSEEAKDLIFYLTNRPLKIVVSKKIESDQVHSIVLTNGDDKFVQDNKLNNRDKIELAGITLLSSTIGILVERKLFKGQHDKMLHANYGAVINVGSNLASYLIIEEMGVGNKLNLNKNQKKMAILLSGTAMGALIGYAKERFYDYYRRKSHTYDPKLNGDTGATMLGGGAVTPLLLTFTTSW